MLADRLLQHVRSFTLDGTKLPSDVGVLDPFNGEHAEEVRRIVTAFHTRFFSDDRQRVLMLGINPGRFGAGLTGIAFTDPNDVRDVLGIEHTLPKARPETSSQFFAQLAASAGGAKTFYSKVYVHSVFPLGFTAPGTRGDQKNLNYYDRKDLMEMVRPHAKEWLKGLVSAGCRSDVVLCLGKGENHRFLQSLAVFDEKTVIALDHPRYIMQYKRKEMDRYLSQYICEVDKAVAQERR